MAPRKCRRTGAGEIGQRAKVTAIRYQLNYVIVKGKMQSAKLKMQNVRKNQDLDFCTLQFSFCNLI